jgi:hypothetical protein
MRQVTASIQIRFVAIVVLVAASSACHSSPPAQPASTSLRIPPPCPGDVGPSLTVAQALSTRNEGAFVFVEGYLVRALGPCTLMNCPDDYPNCNSCEIKLWLASSPSKFSHAVSLYGARAGFACSSNVPTQCVFDATGQHVLARGTLHFSENSFEPSSLVEPQICTLSH